MQSKVHIHVNDKLSPLILTLTAVVKADPNIFYNDKLHRLLSKILNSKILSTGTKTSSLKWMQLNILRNARKQEQSHFSNQ